MYLLIHSFTHTPDTCGIVKGRAIGINKTQLVP